MELGKAANYFSNTLISGWNGTGWDTDIIKVTELPFDRFISEREFGVKRSYILTDPADTTLNNYRVIKFAQTGEICLLGVSNYDLHQQAYSRITLLHRAAFLGDLVSFTKTTTASGMPGVVTRTLVGKYHCDVERITFSRSKDFDATRFSEVSILFPDDTILSTGNEVVVGSHYYDIQETYLASGFRYCRAVSKRSA